MEWQNSPDLLNSEASPFSYITSKRGSLQKPIPVLFGPQCTNHHMEAPASSDMLVKLQYFLKVPLGFVPHFSLFFPNAFSESDIPGVIQSSGLIKELTQHKI
jgi:hypothetical protein